MIDFAIEYSGRNIKVEGSNNFKAKFLEDIPNVLRANLIDVATQFLESEQSQGRFPRNEKEFFTLVDNRLNASELTVKPFGTIQYSTKLNDLKPVLLFAMQKIVERSPERTGAYLANHCLFLNDKFVAKGFSQIISYINKREEFRPTDVFRFVNISPYARKLERYRIRKETQGKNKGQNVTGGIKKRSLRGRLTTIPAGAYVLASRAIQRKFKGLKRNVRFGFIPINPSIARQLDSSGRDTTGYVFKGTKKSPGNNRPYLYPTITVSANEQVVSFNRGFTERGF